MLCDLCHEREALIFIEQVNKDSKRKINLCAECAAARGIMAPKISPDQKNVASIFQEVFEKQLQSQAQEEKLCPGCGRRLSDIIKLGTVGCSECYLVFKEEIARSMNQHGIRGTYTGSLPKRLKNFRNALTDRSDLQNKLEQAVKNEDYEKAAVYRDFLRALEKGSVGDGEAENGK